MRTDPPALSYLEPEGGWRDDGGGWRRIFEERLERKLVLAAAGIELPPSPEVERLVDRLAARLRAAQL